jgi:hypothetical protein
LGTGEPEFARVRVRAGEVADGGSWVYAWLDGEGAVAYVGATGLHPAIRTWLHLHDPDPRVGRVGAGLPRAGSVDLDVLAMRVPEPVSRADVRDAVAELLAAKGLLAADALTTHLKPLVEPAPEAVELAGRFVARLTTYVEQGRPELL